MTKKHFIALADVMRARLAYVEERYAQSPLYQSVALTEVEEDMQALADFCQSQNSQFNRERWLAYIAGTCGPNGGTVRA